MDLIEEIKSRVTIEQLVDRLGIPHGRKTSKGFFIKSIYKDEKTPSMEICTKTNTFRCFATGNHGDIVQLYQDFYSIDIKQAVKELAAIAGIENCELRIENQRLHRLEKKKLIDLIPKDLTGCLSITETEIFNKELKNVFGENLEKEFEITNELKTKFDEDLKKVLTPVKRHRLEINKKIFKEFRNYCNNMIGDEPFFNYLVKQRKLHFRKIIDHKIFFVIDYQRANSHLKKIFQLADLKRSGLYNRKCEKCSTDLSANESKCPHCGGTKVKSNLIFYNHRIIIPDIFNGDIVYLQGRYFDQKNNPDPTDSSKYLYLKNDELNLNRAKWFYNRDILKDLLPGQKIYIVEGRLDVIAMETIGFNAIGITSAQNIPDKSHFIKLRAFEIVICGDNDEAGNEMIEKLKEIFLSMNKEFSIKKLPNKDINDFLKAV